MQNKGLKSWAPVHPYVIQDFNAFLAGLLSQLGIEEAMDCGTMMNEKYHLWDIKDGTVMQEILGFMNMLKGDFQGLSLQWWSMTYQLLTNLQALVQEAGVMLSSNGHNTKKKIIEALLVEPTHSGPPINGEDRMEVGDKAFVTEELVKEYAAEVEDKNDQKDLSAEALTNEEINAIQVELSGIKLPKNLGDAEHGKLKAEQWWTAIEFDLPVILVGNMVVKNEGRSHSLCPNHHACLHLHEFLLRYRPMHGWWMFPFERIIGVLQKTNMNHKIRELERTMLETFCAAASVKTMLQEPGAPDVVKRAVEILQQCCTPFTEEFRTDTGILCTTMELIPYVSYDDTNIIKAPISDILRHTLDKAGTQLNGNNCIMEYKGLTIGGLKYYSCNYSASDRWQDHNQVYYIAIRGYLLVPVGYEDPFLAYSDFRAQIWRCAYSSQLAIVPVCTSELCHTVSMHWGTSELVLKVMNRDLGK
ncbi:hypothetical protein EDD22DRAFT_849772 [Suillus occidentalis]|nr:hypothetical protein EDD22DRAFT_849772 [Suillus occidentalis]